MTSTNLDTVPMELILELFSALNSFEDAFSLGCISKRFRAFWNAHHGEIYLRLAPRLLPFYSKAATIVDKQLAVETIVGKQVAVETPKAAGTSKDRARRLRYNERTVSSFCKVFEIYNYPRHNIHPKAIINNAPPHFPGNMCVVLNPATVQSMFGGISMDCIRQIFKGLGTDGILARVLNTMSDAEEQRLTGVVYEIWSLFFTFSLSHQDAYDSLETCSIRQLSKYWSMTAWVIQCEIEVQIDKLGLCDREFWSTINTYTSDLLNEKIKALGNQKDLPPVLPVAGWIIFDEFQENYVEKIPDVV